MTGIALENAAGRSGHPVAQREQPRSHFVEDLLARDVEHRPADVEGEDAAPWPARPWARPPPTRPCSIRPPRGRSRGARSRAPRGRCRAWISFHWWRGVSLRYMASRCSRRSGRERREVRAPHRGPPVRHARAHVHADAEHLARALADLQVHHVLARRIGRAERDRGGQAVGQLLHERARDVAHVEVAEVGVAEGEHAHRERIAAAAGRVGEVAHLHEREGEAAHGGAGRPVRAAISLLPSSRSSREKQRRMSRPRASAVTNWRSSRVALGRRVPVGMRLM